MTDIFSDFFNALKLNHKARRVIQMPYGSIVTLIADEEDCDALGDNVHPKDDELLNKHYFPRCEYLIKTIQNRGEIQDTVYHYLDFLSTYVCGYLLFGGQAFSNKDFLEWNERSIHCKLEDIINDDVLVYVFDVSLFSKYEMMPERKVCLIFENISNESATIRAYHQYDEDFKYEANIYFDDEYDDSPDWVIYKAIKEVFQSMVSDIIDIELEM